MNLPAFLLALLIASLLAFAFHLWRGGGPGRIFFYLLLAWGGFFSGHFLAVWQDWFLFSVGILRVGVASLGALFVLFMGEWLSKIE